jgi:hypothetical protein
MDTPLPNSQRIGANGAAPNAGGRWQCPSGAAAGRGRGLRRYPPSGNYGGKYRDKPSETNCLGKSSPDGLVKRHVPRKRHYCRPTTFFDRFSEVTGKSWRMTDRERGLHVGRNPLRLTGRRPLRLRRPAWHGAFIHARRGCALFPTGTSLRIPAR